ncbi:MAG: molybdopterin-dependent oxidoreductase [Thermoanaerobacteraceae bacterium]|nr:molybdopterin-dependent oxidoreductase [Thermoanaerobacteraceae bacterium]
MSDIYRSACPLDCFDGCSFKVSVENGIVKRIDGDKNHPFTGGFICSKGRGLANKIYGPYRLQYPLLKRNGEFKRITWDEAYDIIVEKLDYIKRNYSTLSVAHYYESGSGGLLRNLDNRFFNLYGGVSECSGSLCWGAGNRAQTLDFGIPLSHKPEDMLNSRLIVLWGRNPVFTNIHLVPYIEKARKAVAKVVLIDPLRTASAKLADYYYSIRPGSDASLALGLSRMAIERGKEDKDFIGTHTRGYDAFVEGLERYNTEKVLNDTGLSNAELNELANMLIGHRPSTCYIGYGMQRHINGGYAVRAIDALWAVLGNIGVEGGGVNYSHRLMSRFVGEDEFYANGRAANKREFLRGEMAVFLEEADPPIKALFVTKANPLRQVPDTNRLVKAMNGIDFKVTLDVFMTDTCRASDMVLPVTSFLEEEDIIYTTMSRTYLNYAEKVIDRIGEARPEWEIFADIAERMGIEGFPHLTSEEWLKIALKPLEEYGITLDKIKHGYIEPPGSPDIPWQDSFMTESGKFEFLNPEVYKGEWDEKGYSYYLITPHPKDSLHSQGYLDIYGLPSVYINVGEAKRLGLKAGDKIIVSSPYGEISGLARPTDTVPSDVVMIYEGQYGINKLTPIATADLGGQAAIYDVKVNIRRM